MAGVPRKFPTNEIARITYGDEPNELTNARNSVVAKNYNAALEELKKIAPADLVRVHMKQDHDFYKALCEIKLAMTEGGDKAKADVSMKTFVAGAPNSYHYYEAAELVGDLALSMGKYEDAVRAYGAMAKAQTEDIQMRANNSAARALVANKNYADALTRFQAVLDAGLSTPEAAQQKVFATIGKAQCLGETGKPDEGIKMLEEIIQKNDPADAKLFGRTYNALGACQMKAGRAKDAIQAYLHTDVLFYTDGEAHAESLYWLTKLWTDLNKADRATACRTTLRDRYAGSLWNSKE
jgi:tetratricopeptide (TPR) repeat protein